MLCNYRGVRCVPGRVREPGPPNFRAQKSPVLSARQSSVSNLQPSPDPDGPNALPRVPPVLGCPPRKQRPSPEPRTPDWSQVRSVCWAPGEHRGRGRSPPLLPRSRAPGLGREQGESPVNTGTSTLRRWRPWGPVSRLRTHTGRLWASGSTLLVSVILPHPGPALQAPGSNAASPAAGYPSWKHHPVQVPVLAPLGGHAPAHGPCSRPPPGSHPQRPAPPTQAALPYNRQNKTFKETAGLSSNKREGRGSDTVGTSHSSSPFPLEVLCPVNPQSSQQRGHR